MEKARGMSRWTPRAEAHWKMLISKSGELFDFNLLEGIKRMNPYWPPLSVPSPPPKNAFVIISNFRRKLFIGFSANIFLINYYFLIFFKKKGKFFGRIRTCGIHIC